MKHINKYAIVVALGLLAAGCGRKAHLSDAGPLITNEMAIQQARLAHGLEASNSAPEGIPELFSFVTRDTTLQQVVDRVGMYDRVRGSGMLHYEYDFSNGSAVLLSPEWPFRATNRIQSVGYYQDASKINLYP